MAELLQHEKHWKKKAKAGCMGVHSCYPRISIYLQAREVSVFSQLETIFRYEI